VTYYDFRFNDPSPGLATDYWFVRGDPHGQGGLTNPANWGDELRLTDSSFDMEKAPNVSGPFVGDYQGLAAVGNGFLALFAQPHGTDPDSIFSRRIEYCAAGQPFSPASVASAPINTARLAGLTALPSGEIGFDPASVSVALSATRPMSPLPIPQGTGPSILPWRDPVEVLLPPVRPGEWRPDRPHVAGSAAHATTRAVLDSFFADFGDNLEADTF
jgi:hypothetical protein